MHETKGQQSKYSRPAVERAILEVVAGMHPKRVGERDLAGIVVFDATDERETSTFTDSLRRLREFGLIQADTEDAVAPSPALLRVASLFGIP